MPPHYTVQVGGSEPTKWASKWVVILRDVAFVFGSAKARRRPATHATHSATPRAGPATSRARPATLRAPRGDHLTHLLTLSQGWSPFRCFPEESYSLHGSRCHLSPGAVYASGEARTHCLVLQCASGAEVTISTGDAAEAAAWLEAAQAAAAARGAAPPRPRPRQLQGGEGGAYQETRRLEARAAAAREELALVTSEAARVREATARTLGDCAYVLQVHLLLTTNYLPLTMVQRDTILDPFLRAPLVLLPLNTAAPHTAAGADGQARGRDRCRRQRRGLLCDEDTTLPWYGRSTSRGGSCPTWRRLATISRR